MPFYDELLHATQPERERFIQIPVIQRALSEGVDQAMYLAFLSQAYHHVRYTCRLLACAIARCGDDDQAYIDALLEYIVEERGHEAWILDDIRALGGDAEAVRDGRGDLPCRLMVSYVAYAIEHVSPYAMLGMVHVLEGMSASLASLAAASLKKSLGITAEAGFRYLSSHGSLDQDHVAFFRDLVNTIAAPGAQAAIIDAAKTVYRLYGDIFVSIDERFRDPAHAA